MNLVVEGLSSLTSGQVCVGGNGVVMSKNIDESPPQAAGAREEKKWMRKRKAKKEHKG